MKEARDKKRREEKFEELKPYLDDFEKHGYIERIKGKPEIKKKESKPISDEEAVDMFMKMYKEELPPKE